MRRFFTGLVIAAVAIALLLVWSRRGKFHIGAPLPPGKVEPQLVSAWDTAVLLAPDGSLWGWGGTEFQMQGLLPKSGIFPKPQRIGVGSDWRKISSSPHHMAALKSDGSLWAWGNNGSGQIAQPQTTRTTSTPLQIGLETNWTDISLGAGHSLALKSDGSLWAWGQNNHGQVGDGTTSNKFAPTRISSELGWKSIAAGSFNGYALKSDGTLWRWGLDADNGAVKRQNVLVPTQIDPGTNWAFISASDFLLMAVKTDGTLWVRGQNAHVAASYYVAANGANFTQIGTDTDWQDVWAGRADFFVRKRDGSWWFSGNPRGQVQSLFGLRGGGPVQRVPFDFEPWAFANGLWSCLLLTKDGTLWTWGERPGEQTPAAQLGLKTRLNRLLKALPGHWPRFNDQPEVFDAYPHRLWELPAGVRGSLGTNQF
jgi:alpha-tubulin suppressor-like RCC1 family protein